MKKRNSIVLFLFSSILIGIMIYGRILVELFLAVMQREGSSHGLFIPFLSLYFIWLKREKLRKIETQLSPEGLIVVVIGFLLYFGAGTTFYIQSLSFFIVVSGISFFFVGKGLFREVAFPVLFLICMIPIPPNIYSMLADLVRDTTLNVTIWVLALTRVPFLRENFLVYLPNASLSVNMGCSGIRYLISYFVFGIAYAYIFKTRLVDRILIVILTIPLSLLASVMRLMAIFLSTYYIGAFMAEHTPHIIISWSVFFVILVCAIMLERHIVRRNCLKKADRAGDAIGGDLLREQDT